MFMVAILHLLCRVSREHSNFVLVALRSLLDKALGSAHPVNQWYLQKTLDAVSRDVRTVLTQFNVAPVIVSYASCPKCCALYPYSDLSNNASYPEQCNYQESSGSNPCAARLRKTCFINGQGYHLPIRPYLYQDLAQWVARLISRPGLETLLERPLHSVIMPRRDIYDDIWDAQVIHSFVGPDSKPFFQYQESELRLLFSLSYDNFNPYHNKAAGKKVSVGAIFMVCLNLPPMERYKFENIYLAVITPGPKAPSITQLNHYFCPLMDQLDVFFKQGYFLTQTPKHSNGRNVRVAMIPVVADLHAARQAAAFGSSNSTFCCSFCGLLLQDIEEVDLKKWPPI